MVQREVADRVTAAPGTRDYGLLSVTVQMHGPVERLFTLPPSAFSPPPQGSFHCLSLAICAALRRTGRECRQIFCASCGRHLRKSAKRWPTICAPPESRLRPQRPLAEAGIDGKLAPKPFRWKDSRRLARSSNKEHGLTRPWRRPRGNLESVHLFHVAPSGPNSIGNRFKSPRHARNLSVRGCPRRPVVNGSAIREPARGHSGV